MDSSERVERESPESPSRPEAPSQGLSEPVLARIAEQIVRGPFGRHLDFRLEFVAPDHARVRLPYAERVANGVGVVHGGAISALIDTAATAAAWASDAIGPASRGATAGLTVSYLAPGHDCDLVAEARVLRRGGVCAIEVDVRDASSRHVARGLVTYRMRRGGSG